MKRETDSAETGEAAGLSRRSFIKAATAVSAVPALGSAQASTSDQTTSMTETTDTMTVRETFAAGGTHLVGAPGYDTIQAAWDAASSGDVVRVHASYDAQAAGEQFPVVLDYEEKEVLLTGGHPSGSVIDASHTNENVIEVLGRGMNDYRNNPVVENLKLVGGNVGLRIRAAPFSSYRNIVCYKNGSHGISVEGYTDPESGREKGTFGANFYNCQSWVCGGDGFRTTTDAMPHGATFFGCKATWNEGKGFNVRGYSTKIFGGDSQLNKDVGVKAKSGKAIVVQGMYIEGNSRDNDHPVDLYATNADGLVVKDCYFHGINPSSTTHGYDNVLRGVNVHDTRNLSVQNCSVRHYGEGFVALFGCADADVYADSHYRQDADLWALHPNDHGNERTRSRGTILPTDLSNVEGACECDRGYHVGNRSEGPAVWHDGRWHVAKTNKL